MFQQRRERGAAAIEFALVFVLLITLLFGILEGGRLWMMQASLASAARDAARELAINGTEADPVLRANAAFPFGTLTGANVAATPCPVPSSPTASASVVTTLNVELLSGLFVESVDLRGEGVMRCGG